jgi:lipopolysaccharide export LptBFGC system permease protein LptF
MAGFMGRPGRPGPDYIFMKIIDRYVGLGVLATTLMGVFVLSMVLVVGNIFKELLDLIINHDVPIETVLAFMAFVIPFSLTFTIPWGFLTAILLFFGRMSADNELIALRANGVGVPRVCVPVFVLAGLLTAICFFINIEVAPRAEQEMSRAVFRIATNNPIKLFSADEVVDQFPDRRVYVGGKEGENLKNVIVFEINEDNYPVQMVHAKTGVLTPDPENTRLMLELTDARFEQRAADDPRDLTRIRQGIEVEKGNFPIPLDAFYEEYLSGKRMSAYTLGELIEFIGKGAGGKPTEAHVELNRRFSVSLACMAFALIAIPLGITAHRKETSVGFALSLVVAFSYFFFIIMADTFRGNPNAFPSVLIWIPNFLFMTLGGILFYRLSRR